MNKAKRTPSHPTKSHIVVAKEGDRVRTIRFGQQGVSGSPPKKGESQAALVSGCAKTTGNYCDISTPLYFVREKVVKYLLQHDTILLREIVIHNETQKAICG